MTELEQRLAVVASGRRWRGTPYHHNAAVLGAGVDCARVILESFVGAGIETRFDLGEYTHDWHLHRSEEKYLEVVERFMRPVDAADVSLTSRGPDFECQPADVLVFKVGRTFSHGALVTKWPYVLHASYPAQVVEEVDVRGTPMAERVTRVYSYWGK